MSAVFEESFVKAHTEALWQEAKLGEHERGLMVEISRSGQADAAGLDGDFPGVKGQSRLRVCKGDLFWTAEGEITVCGTVITMFFVLICLHYLAKLQLRSRAWLKVTEAIKYPSILRLSALAL